MRGNGVWATFCDDVEVEGRMHYGQIFPVSGSATAESVTDELGMHDSFERWHSLRAGVFLTWVLSATTSITTALKGYRPSER